jgi:hypothetical protein
MIHPEITVTLTLDDIKLYDRAREIGLPSIVVSMYGDRIKKLLAEERSTEREACAKLAEQYGPNRPIVAVRPSERIRGRWEGEQAASSGISAAIRARGEQA